MKKNIISKACFAAAALSCAFSGAMSSAAPTPLISPTLNNGDFESTTVKTDFVSPTSSSANIPYWGASLVSTAGTAVAAPSDSGVQVGGGVNQSGASGAFWQPGGNSTAFNLVTNYTIATGDLFTLTWWAYATGTGGQQTATLYSQSPASVGATYAYAPSATLATAAGDVNPTYALTGNDPTHFTQYTLTYTALASDAGKYIGITMGDSGTAYMAADDFNLTVTAVPEPATLALLVAGMGGLILMRRFHPVSE